MGSSSTEDQTKPSNLYDPPSSPTHPLLSSKPYPDDPIIAHHHGHYSNPSDSDGRSDQYPLQISYNYGPRPIKDLTFLILFSLLVLFTYGFGIFASINRNPNSTSSHTYNATSISCVQLEPSLTNPLSVYSDDSSLLSVLIWTLVITLFLSVPFVLFVLFLLRHYTGQLVYISLPFFVLIPIFINIYWFVACTVDSNCSDAVPLAYRILALVFVFLVIGVVVWIIFLNWHRIELTVKIIGVASRGLSKNLGLFGVLPALSLGLVAYFAPIVVFLVYATQNGKVVTKEKSGEYYCTWKQDSWVPAYFVLAVLTMLWSAAAMVETQAYVVSGTIAQWYFDKDDTSPRRSLRNSLRNAFGPSFGTICLSGLLICVVRVVRALVDSSREEDASGMVNLILRCCVNALVAAFDFLNKFTINFAAITGEAYCTSAKMTYELLRRNLLSTVFVETISTRLLAGIVFVLSAVYAIVVCAIVNAVSNIGMNSYMVAGMAWLVLLVVLGYFVHVMDDVIDTVYVCYAIDRDRGEACKQEVHEVYVHLPITRNSRGRSPLLPRTPFSSL